MTTPRLTVLDDGLFVRTAQGSVHPVAATFHRFVEAVVAEGGFGRTRYLAPVRELGAADTPPVLPAVDQALLDVVPTAPFGGIADYLARLPLLWLRNWPRISRAVAASDLVWLRLPASNALLALAACRRHRVPYFGWLAGSVESVAAGQRRPLPLRLAARLVGRWYDAVSRLAGRGGPVIELDGEHFASILDDADVLPLEVADGVREEGPWRIAWAGRMAAEKGLVELLAASRSLLDGGLDVELLLIGDGPLRRPLERSAATMPAGRVVFAGHVGERRRYLDLLRSADLFAHPSHAEGVPKVIVEALASGLPVVATDVGAVRAILDGGRCGILVPAADSAALAAAVRRLLLDPEQRRRLRRRGLEWAVEHTARAQARRLVAWLAQRFPHLGLAA